MAKQETQKDRSSAERDEDRPAGAREPEPSRPLTPEEDRREEEIVADPEGARRHGETPAA